MTRLFTALAVLACTASAATIVVNLPYGSVIGSATTTGNAFWGIPFAVPPAGSLRWMPPEAWKSSFPSAGLNATVNTGIMCFQPAGPGSTTPLGTEDCLYLNVYTPLAQSSEARPVFFWIHGGGFSMGSGQDTGFDGRNLATAKNAIVVTINYRLGPLGFFALDELLSESGTTGNYGILDQIEALRWVQKNIAAFGGDPNRVLLFGESAGAGSTVALVALQSTAGLYRAAVAQSTPYEPHPLKDAVAQSTSVAENLGCKGSGAALLKCLRAADGAAVLQADPTDWAGAWGVTIDGKLYEAEQNVLISSGKFNNVPIIQGTNENEANLFVYMKFLLPVLKANYPAAIVKMDPRIGNNASLLADILKLYPASTGDHRVQLSCMTSDLNWTCTWRRTLKALSLWNSAVYAYRWFGQPNCTFFIPGSAHSFDIDYIFQNFEQCPLTGNQLALGDHMRSYWNSMVLGGNPNAMKDPDTPVWPTFPKIQALDPDGIYTITAGVRSSFCDFWDTVEW